MRYFSLEKYKNPLLFAARILLMLLFVIFGWQKLVGFGNAAGYMAAEHLPFPTITAAIVVMIEFGLGLLLVIGFYTRPIALFMMVYTLLTALIGHHYWNESGMQAYGDMINFYKNISIMGGLLLLALTGPGKYSLDQK
ncbi:DoxX family protein [Celerinatantimonas yamalensis]|uniref:DoxX family protein n=1 Tax=Celerinatantimonas yamalensis TaxID=559956 RepID=A0ABW9G3G5_9GAMM